MQLGKKLPSPPTLPPVPSTKVSELKVIFFFLGKNCSSSAHHSE